jgi:hypothetical protein
MTDANNRGQPSRRYTSQEDAPRAFVERVPAERAADVLARVAALIE